MTHGIRTTLFCLLVAIAAPAPAAPNGGRAPALPPVAPVREVVDTYFGTSVADPYRWMEERGSAELDAWMRAQNAYARAEIARVPERDAIVARLERLESAIARVSGVKRSGDRYFYYKLAPGDSDRKLCVRDGLGGTERVLVDPTVITGARYSVMDFTPSPDGSRVAYLVSPGGAEAGEIRVVETATGRDLGERIDRTRWTGGAWLPDGRSFLYGRFPKLAAGAPETERLQRMRVFLHVLGTDPERDVAVFGAGVAPGVDVDPKHFPFPTISYGSKYAVIQVSDGVSTNAAFYVALVASLAESPIPWRKVGGMDDKVSDIFLHGDDLYAITFRDAPRFKVVRTSVTSPDLARARTVVPASEPVITGGLATRDALYVRQLDGGVHRLLRVDFGSEKVERVALPFDGSIRDVAADPREREVVYSLESWVKPAVYFALDPSKRTSAATGLQPPSPIDVSSFESVEVKAPSHDGTMVPLSILYKRGIDLDGKNPTVMSGYGAYGHSQDAFFLPAFFEWIERGGVVAFAHVRGGGEYGREWHEAGRKATKPNTWKDFIACAEYLVREKYTGPEHLAGHGASAGGILIGNAIAERPDLFGAAVIEVGLNDMLRYETTANGVPNVPEFGSVTNEREFRWLYEMDPYHKIRPGVKYPAVLLVHGINDPRVEPWFSAKTAARLQAATTSGAPVLLRIDYDAGHGLGTSQRQRNEQFGDTLAFLLGRLRRGER